jgi:hypothetical protein
MPLTAWRALRIRDLSPAGQRRRAWPENENNAALIMLILHLRNHSRRFGIQTAVPYYLQKNGIKNWKKRKRHGIILSGKHNKRG